MSEVNMYKARETYYDIIGTLNEMGWRYDRFDEKLAIKTGVKSQDLPIEFIMMVDAKHQLVLLKSFLPFAVPEDKQLKITLPSVSLKEATFVLSEV